MPKVTYLPARRSSVRVSHRSRPKSHRSKPRRTASRRRNTPFEIRRSTGGAVRRGAFTPAGGILVATIPRGQTVGRRKASKARSRPKSRRTTHPKARKARKASRPKSTRKSRKGRSKGRRGGKRKSKGSRPKSRKSKPKTQGGFPRRANPGYRTRTRTVLVTKTKRLRNPVGFDSADSLKHISTWGKVALGILFGLGGAAVALGIPKALAVATGKDLFQRGWGGVATSAAATIGTSLLVGLVSKKAGYAILVSGLTFTTLCALYALFGAKVDKVIPVQESLLAAALPTVPGNQLAMGAQDFIPGNTPRHAAVGAQDYWAANPALPSSAVGNDSSYYGSPLQGKERF